MTRKLEELLNLPSSEEPVEIPEVKETPVITVDLQEKLEEFDKISKALPVVKGLGEISDQELDDLAVKAEQSYSALMDLGMNVEVRYSARMFEIAAQMMNAAIQAKSAKIDKKLKMVDLQIKKLAIDRKHSTKDEDSVDGEGYVISDRNSLLEKLRKMNK
jgi:hypothetical protein